MMPSPVTVLFDLDGTLADTAPGLAAAANRQRERQGLPPMAYDRLRPVASQGARGLLRVALDLHPGDPAYDEIRLRFLEDYAALMYEHSRLFPGIEELLDRLRNQNLSWGIVTNKMTALAAPLVAHMQLDAAVIVCGDTTAHAKPHPAPLLHAAEQIGQTPSNCLYIGDDLRDIQAGHASGMHTVAAAWGYCGDAEPIQQWQAHHIANLPIDTWAIVQARLSP